MATKKKTRKKKKAARKKPLFVMWQDGTCADDPKLKLYSAVVGGGAEFGPVTAPTKTKGKQKLLRLVKAKLR